MELPAARDRVDRLHRRAVATLGEILFEVVFEAAAAAASAHRLRVDTRGVDDRRAGLSKVVERLREDRDDLAVGGTRLIRLFEHADARAFQSAGGEECSIIRFAMSH